MRNLFLYIPLTVFSISCIAQTPFKTLQYLDINKIKAPALVHGDMWWSPYNDSIICEFPKGNNTGIVSNGGIWTSAYDAGNNLHLSAQTDRKTGSDYWPGPLDSTGNLTYTTSASWAKIWKINYADILTFLSSSSHTISNTPLAILQWPAKGNPYAIGNDSVPLTITIDMAPFVDVDHDGLYNPLKGDYPQMKGDQMLWWVFSDNGPTHNNTNATPLKIEIHAMAYGYSRGTLIDNVVYYEYDIYNKSTMDYSNFRIGQMAQAGLGNSFDDYIGFDSSHRLGVTYYGKSADGDGSHGTFGSNIPIIGVTIISLPGDDISAGKYAPAGSFTYYNNDRSTMGVPTVDTQFNNLLHSKYTNGRHVTITCSDSATGSLSDYVFTGNPLPSSGQWSQCACSRAPASPITIITSNDFTLLAGGSQKITLALIATKTDLTGGGCPNATFTGIKIVADTAWQIYQNPLPPTAINNIQAAQNRLIIYPNPAQNEIFIETSGNMTGREQILIYDALGRTIYPSFIRNNNRIEVNINELTDGVYTLLYRNDIEQKASVFIKK